MNNNHQLLNLDIGEDSITVNLFGVRQEWKSRRTEQDIYGVMADSGGSRISKNMIDI
jgi:hypothetical protein